MKYETISATSLRKGIDRALVLLQQAKKDPAQISMFDGNYKDDWMNATLELAHTFHGPFWFSDLRAKCAIAPGHPNWYGSLTRMMKKEGFYQTGQYRKSPTKLRKGGLECQWAK